MRYLLNASALCFVILTIAGCTFHQAEKAGSATDRSWQTLTILQPGVMRITVNNDQTFSVASVYNYVFTKLGPKVRIDTLKVYFTPQEKVTIARLTKNLITNPVKAYTRCEGPSTLIELHIQCGQSVLNKKYEAVCGFRALSVTGRDLYNILCRRVKGLKSEE